MSRPTRGPLSRLPIRGCHPLWPAFPDASGTKDNDHWPVPRSLATTDGISRQRLSPPPSRAACAARVLMSVPPATEMFQFAGFASCTYEFSTGYPCGWVAPFGDPGITDRSHLPRAFRSVPRPSSPLSAKASTRCPSSRLITASPSPAMPHHRRAQGQAPCLAPAKAGDSGPRMKTLLSDISGARSACSAPTAEALLRRKATSVARPDLSASVTSQLSLHPSINPAAVARGGVARSSPNVAGAAAPVGRQNSALPVLSGLLAQHLSRGEPLVRRWWR